jgi:N,N'-diacetyllegionaminate synthase
MTSTAIRIADRMVGAGHPCFIIAEAGINHNGKLDMAIELVDVAVASGADAVKFQTFDPDTLVTKSAGKAQYQKSGDNDTQTFYDLLKSLQLPDSAFETLSRHCAQRGIIFMSKGYFKELDLLVRLGVPVLKIDSASAIYYSLLRKAAGYGLPVILSTGGCNLGEVEKALSVLAEAGNPPVIVLHCTTAYPAPVEQVNLRAMNTLREAFGVNVGLSDHSQGIEVSLAAVALGATAIEKHFTLDRSLEGPDHQASLEPAELTNLVNGIRKIEAALGQPRKRATSLELENLRIVRRSLVAERAIRAGERFSADSVTFKRPSGGLGEDMLEVVVGRVAARDIGEGEAITWDVIGGRAIG